MPESKQIEQLLELKKRMRLDEKSAEIFQRAYVKNKWFTIENIERMFSSICDIFLDEENLKEWTARYDLSGVTPKGKIGLVLAGNIPLVGFHDFLSVFLSGRQSRIKLSSKDEILFKWVLGHLHEIDEQNIERHQIIERLVDFDAVIATGSNNTSRYFKEYFGKYPHIIRKNRTSVAVLDGSETDEELEALGEDVFSYFGLGCRNVSKIFIPTDYDLTRVLKLWEKYAHLRDHNKYKNNYDYYRAIYLLNREEHLASDHIMLLENESLFSPISTLYYSRYDSRELLDAHLKDLEEDIQCIVGGEHVKFGQGQFPALWDYADGVDTLQFLINLEHQL